LKSQKSETFMEAFFSVLKPGAEIPPHFCQTNAGLTVHFPLVITDHAGIMVANHRHTWQPGETFVFDDSFEHKAWNRSDQIRIVLILGDWHPGLTAAERTALDECVPARLDWMGEITLENLLGA
ncbi:MAG: aspartyl/asparaginyl beta-hydroxylase domain-containing protein, partial [Sphingomonadales bacterium]